jgi:hypothetical protein
MQVNAIPAPNKEYSFNYNLEDRVHSIGLSDLLSDGLANEGRIFSVDKECLLVHSDSTVNIYKVDPDLADGAVPATDKLLYTIALSPDDKTSAGGLPSEQRILKIVPEGLTIGGYTLLEFASEATGTPTDYRLSLRLRDQKQGETEVIVQIDAVTDTGGGGVEHQVVDRHLNQVNTSGTPYSFLSAETKIVYAYDESLKTYKKNTAEFGDQYRLVGLSASGTVSVVFDFTDTLTTEITGPRTNFQYRVYDADKKGFEFDVDRYILLQFTSNAQIDFSDPATMEEISHQLETLNVLVDVSCVDVDFFLMQYKPDAISSTLMPTHYTQGKLIVLQSFINPMQPKQIIGYCRLQNIAEEPISDNPDLTTLVKTARFKTINGTIPKLLRITSETVVSTLNGKSVLVYWPPSASSA